MPEANGARETALIIQCSNCHARYNYDDSRFGTAATKKIRCTKCSTVFDIRNPAAPAPRPVRADDFALDETALTEVKHDRKGPLPTSVPGSVARSQPLIGGERPRTPIPPPQGPEPISATFRATRPVEETPSPAATTGGADLELQLPEEARLSLACIAGPDAGRIFEIDKPRVVIGRAAADIVVADIQCSRQHAALEVAGEDVWLVDLNSTNGTFVSDRRITRMKLENRGEFEVGSTTLMLIKSARDATPGT